MTQLEFTETVFENSDFGKSFGRLVELNLYQYLRVHSAVLENILCFKFDKIGYTGNYIMNKHMNIYIFMGMKCVFVHSFIIVLRLLVHKSVLVGHIFEWNA